MIIQGGLEAKLGISLSASWIRYILRHKLGLKYRIVRHQDACINTGDNLYLRKLFAVVLCRLLREGKTILNFDECVIEGTTGKRRCWTDRTSRPARNFKGRV